VKSYVKDGELWSIEQIDKTLSITERGKTSVRRFVSVEHAALQLGKLVGDKLAAGFVETDAAAPVAPTAPAPDRESDLIAVIAANPGDRDAYAVLADHLVEQGDPRGELIALQLAEEHDGKLRGRVERHLARHARRLLGPLARVLDDIGDSRDGPVRWARGFIREIVLRRGAAEDLALTLDELLELPAARLVESIALRCGRGPVDAIRVLVKRHPTHLRELELDGVLADLAPVWRAVPPLRKLVVSPRLAAPNHERDTTEPAVASPVVRAIAAVPGAALQRLDIDLDEVGTLDDLAPLLARTDLPALTHLRLRNSAETPSIVTALAAAPLAAQLEVLDLGQRILHHADYLALIARRAQFPRLRELWVNTLYPVGGTELAAAFPRIVKSPVRHMEGEVDINAPDEDDEHYDDVAE
jgi:uncharacterized protein (TIGR02996 family)